MSRRVYLIPSGSASWRGIIQRAAAGPTPAPRPRWWQLALAFLDQVWP
jgi:hypothetical protein